MIETVYGGAPRRRADARDLSRYEETVRNIVRDVRENGDKALLEYTRRFDCETLQALRVAREEICAAVARAPARLMETLALAKDNISLFHKKQLRDGFEIQKEDGAVLGQRVLPLASVGAYVPGGTAAYPSSALMTLLPAKIAGVARVVMATPPGKDGLVPDALLCAAHVCGVDEIYKCGGAQAVAALAYGTETVPPVDKIVGPGNIYVTLAKKQLYGVVGIDMTAGPSEILILADAASSPARVAADMLSQAEHDKNASAILVTDSDSLAGRVCDEIERQLKTLPREAIARASIEQNGKIYVVETMDAAIDIVNAYAPEHLEICVDKPFDCLARVRAAGSVFLGRDTPEAFADYLAGPNHVLPTGGSARFFSPLSVDDFVKKTAYAYYPPEAARAIAHTVAYFAREEGLEGHARSALSRAEEGGLA